ncbi:type II toxin-antitoxin system prevent-host-death family antitoxin, partial [Mycobacterium tuberculosis]
MPAEVASRELRNNTAGLLRRVQAGEDITRHLA